MKHWLTGSLERLVHDMPCDRFDPIASACAPSCWVCSYHRGCEKEKTVVSAANTNNGIVERGLGTSFSTSIITKCNGGFKNE